MLQLRISTFIVMILVAQVLPAFGFILERPNNILAALDIPANWNTSPPLQVEQKSSSDHPLNGTVRIVESNKQTQASESKNLSIQSSTKENEVKAPGQASIDDQNQLNIQMKRKQTVDSHATGLRNVVLFLLVATGKNEGKILRNISPPLEVDGYLQTCNNVPTDALRFSTEDVLLPGSKGDNCNCEHFLRMNVGSLLMWARHEREMATGTVLSSNFTLPSPLKPHRMPQHRRTFEEFEESRETPTIPKVRPEIHDDWRAAGFQNHKERSKSSGNATDIKDVEVGRSDNMWGTIDEFSKLRLAFFRKLLESLTRNMGTWPGVFGTGKPYRLHSNLTELTANTIRELKSVPSESGYMMMVAAPEDEAIDAIEFLRREITEEDTLLVLTEVCSRDSSRLAFLAEGPGSKALREATMVWELPTVIRDTIVSSCQLTGCPTRRHTMPNAIFEVEVHREPFIFPIPGNELASKLHNGKKDEARTQGNSVTDGGKLQAYGDSFKLLQDLQARLT